MVTSTQPPPSRFPAAYEALRQADSVKRRLLRGNPSWPEFKARWAAEFGDPMGQAGPTRGEKLYGTTWRDWEPREPIRCSLGVHRFFSYTTEPWKFKCTRCGITKDLHKRQPTHNPFAVGRSV
jgi:hypothetical protein